MAGKRVRGQRVSEGKKDNEDSECVRGKEIKKIVSE